MKTTIEKFDIDQLFRRKDKINPKPQYQRTEVWTEKKKQLLIDTILRGYDIPKIYFNKVQDDSFAWEIVDGQQRLTSIWGFMEGSYALGEASYDLEFGDLRGKKYDELEDDVKDAFTQFYLSVTIIEDATDLEVRDLFQRLQEGVALNPQERRNAMCGNMRDFVAETVRSHKVFALTSIKNSRFEWDNLMALVTCLELNEGPVDIKATSLTRMYKEKEDFDKEGAVAKRIIKVLNILSKVLFSKPPEMDIKWGFVDLYLAISRLQNVYVLKDRESDICNAFVAWEQSRRSSEDLDELARSADPWERDMCEYRFSFEASGGTREAVQKRHDIYRRVIINSIGDLMPVNQNRMFNSDERIVLWRRANGTCQNCGCSVKIDSMHADHVIPHSRGGATTLENGQCLCVPCNSSKGANA